MDRLMRMCLNWKVLGALALLGVGVWIAAPNLVGLALPVLVVALCPLSMLLMARHMRHGESASCHHGDRPSEVGLPRGQGEELVSSPDHQLQERR